VQLWPNLEEAFNLATKQVTYTCVLHRSLSLSDDGAGGKKLVLGEAQVGSKSQLLSNLRCYPLWSRIASNSVITVHDWPQLTS